jgi:ERCC4-type nuclease
MTFNVVVDTREQLPWDLTDNENVDKVIIRKLETGDYTVEGLEEKLCIERKGSVSELAQNVTASRFKNVLKRMRSFKHAFLLLEFGIDDIIKYPYGSKIPRKVWRKLKVKGPFIMKAISHIQIDCGIHVIFCDDVENAKYIATNIMKRVSEKYENKRY